MASKDYGLYENLCYVCGQSNESRNRKIQEFCHLHFLFKILSAAYASSNTFIPLQNTFQILKKNPAVILKANNLQSIDFKQ